MAQATASEILSKVKTTYYDHALNAVFVAVLVHLKEHHSKEAQPNTPLLLDVKSILMKATERSGNSFGQIPNNYSIYINTEMGIAHSQSDLFSASFCTKEEL
jgi:hypothetical protein